MLNKFFRSISKSFGLKKSLKTKWSLLKLDSLETRINPSQVVDVTLESGSLVLKSQTQNGEVNIFDITQPDSLAALIRLQGTGGTIFKGTVNLFSSGYGTAQAEINTLNLPGFNRLQVRGGEGDDYISLGNLDGNVIGDQTQKNFGFNIDTFSSNAGSSKGSDYLTVNGIVSMKDGGEFVTDITPSGNIFVTPGLNLDGINVTASGFIQSIGTGRVRLVADGLIGSTINFQNNAGISNGSGDIFMQSGSFGSIQLNGNKLETIGGGIEFNSDVVLNASSRLETGLTGSSLNGVIFQKTVSGVSPLGQNLAIQSKGPVIFNQDAGTASIPLGAVTIGENNSLANPTKINFTNLFAGSLAAYTNLEFNSSGTLNLASVNGLSITTTDSSSIISLGAQNSLVPAVSTANLGPVNITNANILNINADIVTTGPITQTGTTANSQVFIGNSGVNLDLKISSDSQSIRFSSPVTLNQNLQITSNSSGLLAGGSAINFGSTVDGLFQIQASTGIGNFSFNGAVGSVNPVGAITVTKTNSFTAAGSINAQSLVINQATGSVLFNGNQTYTNFAGLNIATSTVNGNVFINAPILLQNNAQLSINNSGFLNLASLASVTANTGNISLGGNGGGDLFLYSGFTTNTGNISFLNPVYLYNDLNLSSKSGSIRFSAPVESMKQTLQSSLGIPANLTITSPTNNATVSFVSTVGLVRPLGSVTINSSKDLVFTSNLKAASLTIQDMTGGFSALGDLVITGAFVTNTTSNPYNVTLTGSQVQISGSTLMNHLGTTILGDSNSDSFLFSGGFEETGAGGITARGSFVSGSSISLTSELTIGGNNVGAMSLDFAQDSVFYSRLNVQPNERLTINSSAGLRLINNTGGVFQGTLAVNSGSVTVLDNFDSIFSTIVSGGTISGIGSYGNISALSGVISPGDIVGALSTRSIVANNISTMLFELGTVSTANDQLIANGTVTLNSPILSVTPGQFLRIGSTVTIISNDGNDAVIGTFAGLSEGSTFTSGNFTFQISYKGGSNKNDVTLNVINGTVINPPPSNPMVLATAASAGGGPMVTVKYVDGHEVSFWAYNTGFTGGVRIAMGDVNGDGYTDLITGVGVGGGPHIKVWDIKSGAPIQVASFFAFESTFTGGLYVGVGNLNGDAYADIIVGAGPGGGPRVSAYAGAQAFAINPGLVMTNFFAYGEGFRGGVTVAAADRTGDGVDEIVTGAGYGGGPNVSVFQLVQTTPNQFNPQLIQNFFAFDSTFTGGIFVAGGRFSNGTNSNGQILDDIFVGTGSGTKATVAIAFGTGGFYYLNPFGNFQGGVRVGIASTSPTPGGTNYLMAAAGPGGGPQVNTYAYSSTTPYTINQVDQFFALNPNVTVGVFANTTIL